MALAAPLAAEDQVVQTMPEVSPTKWHLAHITWFFERFCLLEHGAGYQAYHERYLHLFNSYYYTVGNMYKRVDRGLLSRPTVAEVYAYRAHVDEAMLRLIEQRAGEEAFAFLVTLGLHHEQQHQELLLTDIKQVFFVNPLAPAYCEQPAPTAAAEQRSRASSSAAQPPTTGLTFTSSPGGIEQIGASGAGFCFDNETPRHRVLVEPHALGNRLVTNADYREFMDDGGYADPALWLSDGWAKINSEGWTRPLCWSEDLEREFSLSGWRPVDADAPVCHVSFYEADAFARWAGARLPSEAEWELAAARSEVQGNLLDTGMLRPTPWVGTTPASPRLAEHRAPPASANDSAEAPASAAAQKDSAESSPKAAARHEGPAQLFGDVWEWTASNYSPYPGFKPLAGSLGEYNGKFMCNQMVVRGGSCVTWADHIRASYRSFFYPQDRWQFLGFRLAKNA
jgi:ergothioneine biosynthesis protein EgtB